MQLAAGARAEEDERAEIKRLVLAANRGLDLAGIRGPPPHHPGHAPAPAAARAGAQSRPLGAGSTSAVAAEGWVRENLRGDRPDGSICISRCAHCNVQAGFLHHSRHTHCLVFVLLQWASVV